MKKDMRGSISKNKRKTEEKHPDIKGSIVINGVDYWLSGWARDSEDGPWYSLVAEQKRDQPARSAPAQAPASEAPALDDDIPF
jgi:hypothetical protein